MLRSVLHFENHLRLFFSFPSLYMYDLQEVIKMFKTVKYNQIQSTISLSFDVMVIPKHHHCRGASCTRQINETRLERKEDRDPAFSRISRKISSSSVVDPFGNPCFPQVRACKIAAVKPKSLRAKAVAPELVHSSS